ncbi:MAG TPA: adenylate/guanylate cyclase domain-containing protein [Rhizomicrobium sp.]|nr:adenylate/guanylate cyclase domain-containing protein [Rhizomicrobium sp.]
MRVGGKTSAIWALPLAVLVAALAIVAANPGGVATRLAGIQFDSYQYSHPRPYEDPLGRSGLTVRILDIDAASLAHFGSWPWPHGVLARLTAELTAAGAAEIVFAFPLDAADASSPQRFAVALPPGPGSDAAREALAHLPSPDDSLAQSFTNIRAVTGFLLDNEPANRAPVLKAPIPSSGNAATLSRIPQFASAHPALANIEAASAGIGALNLVADADGKLRAMPLLFRLGNKLVPSLASEAMRLAGGAPNLEIRTENVGSPGLDEETVIAGVKAGTLDVPTRRDGALEIYFSGPHAQRHISAAALDAGQMDGLKNAIVIIAPPGEMVETPIGLQSIAGVRAEAMENILLHSALRPVSGTYAVLVFIAVAGIGVVLLFARAGLLWAGLLTLAAIAAAQAFTWYLFTASHLLLDSLNPTIALVAVFAGGLAARSYEIARTRNVLRRSFSDALPQADFDQIARTPALLKLEGETRTVTCLSCGVRGHAALADSLADDPASFTRMIGAAIAPLVEIAIRHGAMVDCVTGEGFTAYWNAPLDDPEHAIHACEAANRMTIALAEANEQLSHERRSNGTAFEAVEIGIGISTGPAIAGGFGARGRMTYSVTGDCTFLADRIRTLSAQYGPAIVVSDDTRRAAERGYAFLEVDFIAIGAREEPLKLYALLGNPLVRASPKFRAVATFHDHIFQSLRTQQWEKARGLIEQCRKLSGASQKMYDLHLARVAYYEANSPGADWDGAFRTVLK